MERNNTKPPSSSWAPWPFTGEAFQESKSSSHRGLSLELLAKKYFLQHGFCFYAHRFETPFAEVDLVFLKNKKVYFIEVKSFLNEMDLAERVKPKQRQRLERALIWWSEKVHLEPVLLFAFVHSQSHEVLVIAPHS